jgi:chemotaxis protein MotB
MSARLVSGLLLAVVASGCIVLQSTYEEEVVRRETVEAELLAEQERAASLAAKLEKREIERSSLGKERVELLNEIEDLRETEASLARQLAQTRAALEEERRIRAEHAEALDQVQGSYQGLVEKLETEVQKGQIEIHRLRGRLQIRAVEQILFDSGSATVKPEGRQVLAAVANELGRQLTGLIRVEGHTDSLPISNARFPSNWELSSARAIAVLRVLADNGVATERLSAAAMGPYRPIADNETREGRARNRRIEIVIVPEDAEE